MNRIIRNILTAAFLCAFLLAGVRETLAATDSVVIDVRASQRGKITRVVLELSKKVDFTIFTLANPYRIVVDFPQVGWRLPNRPLPTRKGVLEKLRYGLFKPGNSRLVLDLLAPAEVSKAFLMAPTGGFGYRFVVDLSKITRQAFLGNLGRKNLQVTIATAKTPAPVPPSPKATLRVASVTPSGLNSILPTMPPGARKVVVIDPGHGGVDPGTTGARGTYEKHVTLAVAREIKKQIEKTGRFRAILTRNRDVFVRLRDRVAIAREAAADLFISIHANAIDDTRIRGLSVYTLSEKASDAEAALLAEKENKADLIAGIDLSGETQEVTNILIDLAQRESMNQSARVASAMIKELKRQVGLLRNTHRFAGFAVLKAPDVPSVLLEVGFLSNREDERALGRKEYRVKLATSIARALGTYFSNVEEAYRK